MRTLNLSYFDNDLGDYDQYNPRYVFAQKNTNKIIALLHKKEPNTYDLKRLEQKLRIGENDCATAIGLLKNISAISEKDGKYALNFTFLTTKDVKIIKRIIKEELNKNLEFYKKAFIDLNKVALKYYPEVDAGITLYHLICGKCFDGIFFDYIEEQGVMNSTYPKNGDRDYLVVGYQDNYYCNNFNKGLYCSFNNARCSFASLTSFGTPSNSRLDFFRYFKLREAGKLTKNYKKLDCLLRDDSVNDAVEFCVKILIELRATGKTLDDNYLKALKITGYISDKNEILVPFFDNTNNRMREFCQKVVDILGGNIVLVLKSAKEKVMRSNITCLRHTTPESELTNELWHILFGSLNKFLIKNNLVAKPKCKKGEGRYLQCVYFD